MALSARQREHGLAPSHCANQYGDDSSALFFLFHFIPWISLGDNDRRPCIHACAHYPSASLELIGARPWCAMGIEERSKGEEASVDGSEGDVAAYTS